MNRRIILMLITSTWLSVAWGQGAEYRSTRVMVTAYNAVPDQTDDTPWLGACNIRLKLKDRPIAVSRDLFKQGLDCGTEVALEGEQENYVVMDKMNARYTRRIDLFMGKDVNGARAFGTDRLRIWWYDDGK